MREITETSEFSNLTNYLISKISSPYVEISYVIENNDSVEKILNKFRINNTDIKKVSAKLKNQKLTIFLLRMVRKMHWFIIVRNKILFQSPFPSKEEVMRK